METLVTADFTDILKKSSKPALSKLQKFQGSLLQLLKPNHQREKHLLIKDCLKAYLEFKADCDKLMNEEPFSSFSLEQPQSFYQSDQWNSFHVKGFQANQEDEYFMEMNDVMQALMNDLGEKRFFQNRKFKAKLTFIRNNLEYFQEQYTKVENKVNDLILKAATEVNKLRNEKSPNQHKLASYQKLLESTQNEFYQTQEMLRIFQNNLSATERVLVLNSQGLLKEENSYYAVLEKHYSVLENLQRQPESSHSSSDRQQNRKEKMHLEKYLQQSVCYEQFPSYSENEEQEEEKQQQNNEQLITSPTLYLQCCETLRDREMLEMYLHPEDANGQYFEIGGKFQIPSCPYCGLRFHIEDLLNLLPDQQETIMKLMGKGGQINKELLEAKEESKYTPGLEQDKICHICQQLIYEDEYIWKKCRCTYHLECVFNHCAEMTRWKFCAQNNFVRNDKPIIFCQNVNCPKKPRFPLSREDIIEVFLLMKGQNELDRLENSITGSFKLNCCGAIVNSSQLRHNYMKQPSDWITQQMDQQGKEETVIIYDLFYNSQLFLITDKGYFLRCPCCFKYTLGCDLIRTAFDYSLYLQKLLYKSYLQTLNYFPCYQCCLAITSLNTEFQEIWLKSPIYCQIMPEITRLQRRLDISLRRTIVQKQLKDNSVEVLNSAYYGNITCFHGCRLEKTKLKECLKDIYYNKLKTERKKTVQQLIEEEYFLHNQLYCGCKNAIEYQIGQYSLVQRIACCSDGCYLCRNCLQRKECQNCKNKIQEHCFICYQSKEKKELVTLYNPCPLIDEKFCFQCLIAIIADIKDQITLEKAILMLCLCSSMKEKHCITLKCNKEHWVQYKDITYLLKELQKVNPGEYTEQFLTNLKILQESIIESVCEHHKRTSNIALTYQAFNSQLKTRCLVEIWETQKGIKRNVQCKPQEGRLARFVKSWL